jgi:hypothetical protein
MTYRNEGEALRARVEQLEESLADAEARIAKLSGETTSDEVAREISESRILRAPAKVTLTRTLPYEIDVEGYEAIAALVRERLKVEVSQVGRSLTTPRDVFSLRTEGGRTTLRLHGDWSQLGGAVVSVGGLTSFLGGLPIVGVLHDVGMHHPAVSMLHAAWIVPALVTSAIWGTQRRLARTAREKLALHQGTFEAVLALAEKHAIRKPAPRARVAVDDRTGEPQEDAAAENDAKPVSRAQPA